MNKTSNTGTGWMKYEKGPVLGGKYGTCFDISVLKHGDKYRMYFSWRPQKSIALVESLDGIHWSEPVIVLGPRETKENWEDDINRPVVILHGNKYKMWYTGQYKPGLPDGKSWLFMAESDDGSRWERVSMQHVLSAEEKWEKAAVMSPHVIWDDIENVYKLWYSAGEQYEPNAIGYATSTDGVHWNKYGSNPVFYANSDIPWESHKVAGCQIIYKNNWYIMFYIGYRDDYYAQIGIARSRDGITNWERHPENPIIFPEKDTWDGDACYKPFAIFVSGKWMLWYNGRKGNIEQIGLAIHEGENLGF